MSHPVFDDDDEALLPEQLVLSDLVSRVLDKGVVIHARVLLSIADVDLVQLDLRLLLSSVATLQQRAAAHRANLPVRTDAAE